MATSYDFLRGAPIIDTKQALALRSKAVLRGPDDRIGLIDPVNDETWARMSTDSAKPSNYFDYYFSGQDIKVRIAEISASDPDFGDMPIVQLSFNIEQEKQPIYGFWSYVYDAVMRGTRLVSGAFSIATRYPNYMKEALGKAAKNRSELTNQDLYNYPQALTEDDKNIETYWGRNIYDPGIVAQYGSHIFSVHPPFSMIVTFNMQTTSIPLNMAAQQWQNYYMDHYQDPEKVTVADDNHRYAEFDPTTHSSRIVIDTIELKSLQQEFSPDGSVCLETYTFFARDLVVPEPADPSLKKLQAADATKK